MGWWFYPGISRVFFHICPEQLTSLPYLVTHLTICLVFSVGVGLVPTFEFSRWTMFHWTNPWKTPRFSRVEPWFSHEPPMASAHYRKSWKVASPSSSLSAMIRIFEKKHGWDSNPVVGQDVFRSFLDCNHGNPNISWTLSWSPKLINIIFEQNWVIAPMYPMFWTVLGMLNSSKLGDLTDGWVCLLVIIAFRKSLIFCEHGIETASHLPFWLNYNHLLTWKIAVIIRPFGNDSPFFQPIIPMWRHDVRFFGGRTLSMASSRKK